MNPKDTNDHRAMHRNDLDDVAVGSRPNGFTLDLLEATPDAMVIIDKEGLIIRANAKAEKVFGYPRTELTGRSLELLVPSDFKQRHARYRDDYYASPVRRPMGQGLALWGRRRDGSEFPVDISLAPIETVHGMFVSASIREVTEVIALAQRLLRLLTSVEDELGSLLGERRNVPPRSPLTARELEIVRLAAQGMSSRDICQQLTLTHSTVKTHFANIYRKLGVSDRAAAVAYAIRTGLIE